MKDSTTCRNCNKPIFWHESAKTGKKYACDSDNRRDFHKYAAKQGTTTNGAQHRNEVLLAGNLAKPPEIKYTPSGKAVCNLSLVTAVTAKNKQYHRVVLWEDLVEPIAALETGDFLEVRGYIETRSWETSSGEKRYMTQVVGRDLSIGGKQVVAKPPLTPNLDRRVGGNAITASNPITDEDVPF